MSEAYSRPPRPWNRVVAELGGPAHCADPDWWQAMERQVRDYSPGLALALRQAAISEVFLIERAHETGNMRLKEGAREFRYAVEGVCGAAGG
jgi:hypothetical protein